jgi:hypothetical protein
MNEQFLHFFLIVAGWGLSGVIYCFAILFAYAYAKSRNLIALFWALVLQIPLLILIAKELAK